jgi:hypothetical protein
MRPLNTLNSERLVHMGQEVFDISRYVRANICHGDLNCSIDYTYGFPFPPGTKGFFYYHQPPALPPMAGEMRFRICDDASQFAYGRDLEVESERPWNIPLINIVKVGNYKAIRDLLLDEGFVDHELVADMENLKSVSGSRGKGRAIALYDIDQPFSVNLSVRHLHVHLNTRSCVRTVELRPFSIRTLGRVYSPFSGKAIYFPMVNQTEPAFTGQIRARFEIYPQNSDTKGCVLRLRVLEILTPVTPTTPPDNYIHVNTIPEPLPGNFLSRRRGDRPIKPWASSLFRKGVHVGMVRDFIAERVLEKEKYGV